MSSKNHAVKQKMIAKYGAKCWIDRLQIRKDDTPKEYKNKGQLKRMKQLTFHHILERSKGGSATEENGALLSAENHVWLHSQPKEIRDKINQIFQEYKKKFNSNNHSSTSEKANFDLDTNDIELNYDDAISIARARYNRAKVKRTTRKRIDEELEEYLEGK